MYVNVRQLCIKPIKQGTLPIHLRTTSASEYFNYPASIRQQFPNATTFDASLTLSVLSH